MTAPGGGGDRLEVGVVADATGFARDAQAKIDAAAERVKAKIKADIDFRRLQAQAEAAAKRISKQTEIRLQIGVDKKYLLASLEAAVAAANASNPAVKVKVDVDRDQLDRVLSEGGGTVNVRSQVGPAAGSADVEVHADDTGLTEEVRAAAAAGQAEASANPIDVPVRIDQNSMRRGGRGLRMLTQNMTGLQKFGFYAGLVQMLTSAVTAAGGGLLAMAGAASQAVGVLAALPNAVGVAVQGLGALFAGFSGIGEAVGAMGKVQAAAGKSAAQSARQQEQAQKAIARARKAVVDATEQGSRRIAQAEKGVVDSQKASLRAQEALNQARKDATNALQDYQLQLSGAALDEEGAALAIERAREAWNNAMRNPGSTALDRKEADLALRQAEQSLKEIQDKNEELRAEADEATKAGVEGSAAVVGAKEDVVDAAERERDAQQDLADAHVEAAQDIADAQENLADAIASAAEQMGAQSAAASALAAAMDKLSPAGQEFAKFIDGTLKPRMLAFRNAIQQQLLPGVQDALKALLTDPDPGKGLGSYLDVLQGGMEESGRIMGNFARDTGTMMSSPVFRADTATIMASNNRALTSFTGAGKALIDIMRNLAVAAGPQLERFAEFVRVWMEGKQAAAEAGRETGKLQAFMERAGDRAAQLGRIVANLGRTLLGLGKGGVESGDSLLDKFESLTKKWDTWANSDAGQARLREFFANVQPLFESMGATISKITELFVTMGENGGGSLSGMLDAINLVVDALTWLFQSPVGPFLSTMLQFSGAATVFGLVGGKVWSMGAGIFDAGKKAVDFARGLAGGATAATNIGTAAAGAGAKVRDLASAAGGLASAGWTKLKDAATWMFDLGKKAAVTTGKIILQTAAWVAQKIVLIAQAIATGVVTAAQWLLNIAMSMNPIGLIILAIGLLIAAFVWLWNNVEGFRNFWIGVWDWIKKAFTTVVDAIGKAFQAVMDGISNAVQWVRDKVVGAFTWIKDTALGIWRGLVDGIKNIISGIADFVGGIFDGVGNAIKSALNFIIGGINSTIIGGINLVIDGLNVVNPFDDIPHVPKIPKLAQGAIIRRPTLAVVGEDGDEAVIPLGDDKAKRRAQLMQQAGLTPPADAGGTSGIGGWARLDSLSGGRSLAELVATSGGAIDRTEAGGNVGTLIQEGAVKQYITNPAPETASGTLNSGLRRVAATGIFGDGPVR